LASWNRMATHYQILGLKEDAKHEDVVSAYRRLAKKYHPDFKPGDAEQFRRITDSYYVLSDTARRNEYEHSLRRRNIMSDIFCTVYNSILSGVLLTYAGILALAAIIAPKEYMVLFILLSLVSTALGCYLYRK
jgi:curved DNA-binding protein CbpA